MNVVNIDKKYLDNKEQSITARLKAIQDKALIRFEEITGKNSIHSFHAMMGANNNIYVDSMNSVFLDPNDFITRWLEGLRVEVKKRAEADTLKPKSYGVNCSGQQILATVLEVNQYNRSDSFGVNPPLY